MSQLEPAMQSSLVAHCFRHVPSVPQRYGEQLVALPLLSIACVRSALQVEPCTHLYVAVSQRYVSAQSPSTVHVVLQALDAGSHTNSLHESAAGSWQLPLPSQ